MITEDIPLFNEIFLMLHNSITDPFDAFDFEVTYHEEYMIRSLTLVRDQKRHSIADNIDGWDLKILVKQLRENALKRHELWTSFVLTYDQQKVNVSFKYEEQSW